MRYQTVTAAYYISVLKQLMKDHIPKKRRELVRNWKLHHDNARAHVAHTVQEFLAKKEIEIVPHPAYSPDLASNDFFLYPSVKKHLKGKRFANVTEALKSLEANLKRLSKNGFQHVFLEWQRRWKKCILLEGEYIERDSSVEV